MIRGWDLILRGCRWLHEPPPIGNHPVGLGRSHLAGRYRPGALPFRPQFVGFVEMEGFMIQRWDPNFPGCGDWLYGPQPISDQPVGLGFPHRERRYCPRRSPLSCRVCWVRGCMEVLMIRRLDPILPGCRWLSEPPPTISGGIEVSLPCEAASAQEITMFVHSWLKRWMRRRICVPGMGPYPPRLPPVPRTPANQRSASGIGASAPCRQVSTLRITVSSSGRRICGDGSVSDPEMGS